jgi:hypothetical protein
MLDHLYIANMVVLAASLLYTSLGCKKLQGVWSKIGGLLGVVMVVFAILYPVCQYLLPGAWL